MKTIVLALLVNMLVIMNVSAEADIQAGEEAYNMKCMSCHGAKGLAPILPIYPKLGGQNAAYLTKQMQDFQSGARNDPTMSAMAALLQGDDIENVSAYLESVTQ